MIAIADALFTKTRQKIIGLLFSKPDKSYYLNEIVRIAGMGKGTIKRELDKMTSAGLLTMRKIGNQNHYQPNPESPIYEELLAISRKTFGVADILKKALKKYESDIKFAFVYGSVAKLNDTAVSDLDVMIVGDGLVYAELMASLIPVEKELGRKVNPSTYTPKDFRQKKSKANNFISSVLQQDKIMLIGNEDELG